MLKHSKYFKTFDGCAILCFGFELYYETLRRMHEDDDRKGILGSFWMQNRLFELIAGWKEKLGTDMETALASRIGGDGAFVIFKGKSTSRNIQRALCCARELQECHADAHSTRRFKLEMDDIERIRLELLHIAIHVGRVYRHTSELIPLPSDEAKYSYISHDMHICALTMQYHMKEKYDAVLTEQAWECAEPLLVENIQLMRPNKKVVPVTPGMKMSLFGVNFDIIDWDKVQK